MSSNEPIKINEVYYYKTQNKMMWNTHPTEFACHDWLKEAYPDIYKEFVAVMEVAREI